MGNPANYSLELPERCLQLLDSLWPHAQNIRQAQHSDLGPLTATFLISMSMPIINLPIERIERRQGGEGLHYANDRPINVDAASAIDSTLRQGKLADAPFFQEGAWSFASSNTAPFPNISRGVPGEIAEKLSCQNAIQDAANMPMGQWCSVLRNALAHGGIAYLNEHGRSSYGEPVKMFSFVSGKYDRTAQGNPKPLIAVNFLRISEINYREFLRLWVKWLMDTGVAKAAEAA